MIDLLRHELVFRFPEVHEEAICHIGFQRTLRIPDDGREYPLPPGLGRFPLEHVEDHAARLPPAWGGHGGVLLPMYQAEALWISFSGSSAYGRQAAYPFAVKIAAGKVNALTGNEWSNDLSEHPQDYLVLPGQPWLDGFCIRKGAIRQFVAMPLGQGCTAEEQLSGTAEHGGIQIIVYPMKQDRYEKILKRRLPPVDEDVRFCMAGSRVAEPMGLAPGGLIRQEIYADRYGCDAWDRTSASRCFVHILNSGQWKVITRTAAPGRPLSAADYAKAGLPWFEYYDEQRHSLGGSKKLAGLHSIGADGVKLGARPLVESDSVTPQKILPLGPG